MVNEADVYDEKLTCLVVFCDQLVKLGIVDPRVPLAVDAEPFVSQEDAVGMLVLAGDRVVGQQVSQLADKVNHLLVPRNIVHRQLGSCKVVGFYLT